MKNKFKEVKKRDGRIVAFDQNRITEAIRKAMQASGEGDVLQDAERVLDRVIIKLNERYFATHIPAVEEIQDIVEESLILMDFPKVAKAYILYRQKRAEVRAKRAVVPERVRQLAAESKKYFRNPLAEFIYYRTYSRWIPEEGRRETWIETVGRFINFMKENLGGRLAENEYREIERAILNQEVMPSMRLMWSAGKAAAATNVAAYNCSFTAPRRIQDFAEIMYLLMCGTGVGFSVENQNVQELPIVARQTGKALPVHTIEDSKEGWGNALTLGLKSWYQGMDISFDYSKLRPAGARLKTMGGRSSGPEPLKALLDFSRAKMFSRQGRRLSSLDVHDIICKIGEIVVAGGMRRSALISLSDFDDNEMRAAKQGPFYFSDPQRQMANNSAVYNAKPGSAEFLEEWLALAKSGTGERGIFNRGGLQKQLPERRWKTFEKHWATCGTNPCVTGDTLVYAADGRGSVSIKKLAESGEDVPVFCLDNNGRIAIRYMRNPRLTGAKAPVFKVILDDGSVIKATANHKFRMKSGEYREVKDLLPGDSLAIVTRFETSIKDLFPNASANSQDYWWINNGRAANMAEHRGIAEFYYHTRILRNFVVHHRDRNTQNNNPQNLEIMPKEEHDALHGNLMVGDNNPMRRAYKEWSAAKWSRYKLKHSKNNAGERNKNFSGVTDEELKQHALQLAMILGRRFSHKDWSNYAKKNRLPQHFSKWRRDHLGGILGLAKWAAYEVGFEHIDADPRVVDSYKKYTAQGYDCEIVQGRLAIIKNCELCGRKFRVGLSSREYGVCSISCGQKRKWQDNTYKSRILNLINVSHAKRKQAIREAQAKVYSDLRFTLGRSPRKKEWVLFCKENGISPEISRASSPFRTYNNLKEYALQYNHKVISVEFCGYEDVYNGTVDEFHNFFVGGFQSKTKNNKRKIIYLNNLNCGEIVLRSRSFCNLSEVVARSEDTEETLLAKIRIATILGTYQAALTNFPYLSKEWKKNCEEERLLGVSITGQWDSSAVRNPETLRKLRERAIEVNKEYAKRFGINESTCVTCVKPSGCRPWYALTTTDQGLLTLEELFKNHDEQKQWDIYRGSERVIQNPHPAAIIKTYHNGPAKTLKIKMSYGLTVESTPNHQWFVSFHYDRSRGNLYQRCPVNQWVEAKDLRPGDVLEVKLGIHGGANHALLKKINSLAIKMRSDARAITQPDFMGEDLAWLLGYLWGDGAMSPEKYRIRFIDEHVDNLLKAQRIIKEQFGLKSKLHQASGHRNAHTLEIGSKMLWHWLIKNDVFKYYADRIDIIPRLVRGSSYEDVIAFIAGLLDSDGWVGKHSNAKGYTITITTADKFFAQHLQDVAWAVGLGFGRSLNSQGSNLQQRKEMYLLTLGRAVKPEAFVVLQKNSTKLQRASQDKEFKKWLWQNPKANSLIVGKIISIEEGDTLPTYDIEVENHWYYAGAVKSHNTVSQLVDAASGMHPRHAPYYIRRVRISATDPLFQMLREQKFPHHPEVGQLESTATTFVLDFPVKAPEGAAFRNDASAIEQLEHWKMVKENFTEHNPSVTVSIGVDEWISVADWLYANWDILGGLSFLPREEHVYQLAPYEEISEARYNELAAALPEMDFSAITVYEKDDSTTGSKEMACVGNVCEIDASEAAASQQPA